MAKLVNQTDTIKQQLAVEKKIINLMLTHLDVVSDMVEMGISYIFFDAIHQPLVCAIYYEYSQSSGKRLLTADHYQAIIADQGKKSDIATSLNILYSCLYGEIVSRDNLDLLKNQLVDSYVSKQNVVALKKFNDNVPAMGQLQATKELCDDLLSAVTLTEVKKSSFITLPQFKSDYLSHLKNLASDESDIIRCGLPEIDDSLILGFKPGHTTLFVGGPGSHKTNIMLNLAININKKCKKPVLFASLEMDRTDVTHRIVSNQTGVSFVKIANPKCLSQKEKEAIENADLWSSTYFGILDVDERISVSLLRREIEKRVNTFMPKVVFVDYLSLMSSDVKHRDRNDLELGEITKSLKFLGKKYGFHIVTAAQMGRSDIRRIREQGSDATLDTTIVKGSQEISADCENIFALTSVQDEPHTLKIHVVKARYGPSSITKELHVDPGCCRITSKEIATALDGASDDDWDKELNQTADEIIQEVAVQNKQLEFASVDLDNFE